MRSHFAHYFFICGPELRCILETCVFSRSCRNAFRALLLYSKLAILIPELQRSSRAGCVLGTCVFSRNCGAYYFVYINLPISGSALRVVLLYLCSWSRISSRSCTSRTTFVLRSCELFKPELQECTSRATFVLKRCDCAVGAAGVHSVVCACMYVCI